MGLNKGKWEGMCNHLDVLQDAPTQHGKFFNHENRRIPLNWHHSLPSSYENADNEDDMKGGDCCGEGVKLGNTQPGRRETSRVELVLSHCSANKSRTNFPLKFHRILSSCSLAKVDSF